MPQFKGVVEVQTAAGDTTIVLDGNSGDIFGGDSGRRGSLELRDSTSRPRVTIDGETGDISIAAATGDPVVTVDGQQGDIVVYRMVGGTNREILRFDCSSATFELGAVDVAGDLRVLDDAGRNAMNFSGGSASLFVGATGNEGDIVVIDNDGRSVVYIDGKTAKMRIGTTGNEGGLLIEDGGGRHVFEFDGVLSVLSIGDVGNDGNLVLRDERGRNVIRTDTSHAALYVGAPGNEGDVILFNDKGSETIRLDGGSGDIILSNGDAAEDFALALDVRVDPGSVMVIGQDGAVRPCGQAYDRHVVGVVAGAGQYRPGLVLGRRADDAEQRVPISLIGKAACLADASYGPIAVGDLLTTSPSTGCAMRAADPLLASGATIGKALTSLPAGRGMVDMMISLQ